MSNEVPSMLERAGLGRLWFSIVAGGNAFAGGDQIARRNSTGAPTPPKGTTFAPKRGRPRRWYRQRPPLIPS
jgi:hypothetical protein